MLEALSWGATAFSLVGNILIARQSRIGFVVWIVSNILWIVVNVIGVPNTAQTCCSATIPSRAYMV